MFLLALHMLFIKNKDAGKLDDVRAHYYLLFPIQFLLLINFMSHLNMQGSLLCLLMELPNY